MKLTIRKMPEEPAVEPEVENEVWLTRCDKARMELRVRHAGESYENVLYTLTPEGVHRVPGVFSGFGFPLDEAGRIVDVP